MSTRRHPPDILFSKLVRERANWTCESCGKQFERGSAGLHGSHFHSRTKRSTRWDPDNAAAHCATCHKAFGESPTVFARWIRDHLGEEKCDALDERARTIKPLKTHHKKDLRAHLKSELARLENCRDHGVTGRLEFGRFEW